MMDEGSFINILIEPKEGTDAEEKLGGQDANATDTQIQETQAQRKKRRRE